MIDTKELRCNAVIAPVGHMPMELSGSEVIELLDRLEAAENDLDFAKVEIARLHDDIHELTDERDALQAKIADMEQQEPECEVVGQVRNVLYEVRTLKYDLPTGAKLYALPGAQNVPTTLLVAVANLVAQMEIVSRVGFVDTPNDKDSCAAFCVAEGTWLELMSAVESLASALAATPEAKP